MKTVRFQWTVKWPTTTGTYLFRGRPLHGTGRFTTMLVKVVRPGTGPLVYLGIDILYKVEWEGVWTPFDLEEPDAERLLKEASG